MEVSLPSHTSTNCYPLVPLSSMSPAPRVRQLRSGFRYALWRDPARLDGASRDWIYTSLIAVSTRAFGADMGPYWRDRRRAGYLDTITRFALILNNRHQMIGWSGFHARRFGGARCMYIDSTGVVPEHQGQGLTAALQRRFVYREIASRPFSRLNLVMRTESPIVYAGFRRAVGPRAMHPAPGRPVPPSIQRIGRDAAEWLGQAGTFRAPELKIEDAYANLDALYGELPSAGDRELDEFFRAALRPVDAFIVICEVSLSKALRYQLRLNARRRWSRSVPRLRPLRS